LSNRDINSRSKGAQVAAAKDATVDNSGVAKPAPAQSPDPNAPDPWQSIGEQQALFRYLLDQINDGIFIIDPDSGIILDANRAAHQRLGYAREDLVGSHLSTITVNTGKNMSLGQIARKGLSANGVIYEEYHQHRNGRRIPMEINSRLIELDSRSYVVAIARDITDRKQLEEELRQLTTEDSLTRVFNRRFFDESLEQEWRRMMRMQHPISMLMIDVDHFKHYNDTYGHIAGDVCLRQIAAELMRQMRRASDIVSRYGGEEFAVILPETDAETAKVLAETLRESVENLGLEHIGIPDESVVTLSIGVATLVPTASQSAIRLVSLADKALYRAKAGGRNQIQS
jgi:diguanylate cyclase (GGDEF)-like protein/PAS domain S-box-containing protein